jgi:hypothetical protein
LEPERLDRHPLPVVSRRLRGEPAVPSRRLRGEPVDSRGEDRGKRLLFAETAPHLRPAGIGGRRQKDRGAEDGGAPARSRAPISGIPSRPTHPPNSPSAPFATPPPVAPSAQFPTRSCPARERRRTVGCGGEIAVPPLCRRGGGRRPEVRRSSPPYPARPMASR